MDKIICLLKVFKSGTANAFPWRLDSAPINGVIIHLYNIKMNTDKVFCTHDSIEVTTSKNASKLENMCVVNHFAYYFKRNDRQIDN